MINLLPEDTRTSYRYARRNRRLLPWITALVVSIIVLIGIAIYGDFTLNQASTAYNTQIALSQSSLDKAHVNEVKSQVADISGSLRLAVKVLGREVLFSKLLTRIGAVVPSGVNLTGLNINQDDNAIDLDAAASNYQAATQLQANLTDPANQIFSKADLVSVNCASGNSNTPGFDPTHPCSVNIRAQFATDNQFLFISNGAKK